MVRKKIAYELIADERKRRETFRSRKAGFFKKLNDLKMLCDVEACAIVIGGDGTQSEVWPSLHSATHVIEKFTCLPSHSKTLKMVDQTGFLKKNLSRLSKNLDKENRKVRSLEKELLLAQCLNNHGAVATNSGDSDDMLRLLDRKIEMIDRKIAELEPSCSTRVADAKETANEPRHGKGKKPL